jgi:disintegrin and metalloproteinase domain-containing protein 17
MTTLFWIPSSCLISYFDRRSRHSEIKEHNWKQQLELVHSSDRRRLIHIRVPRQKITVTAARM